MTQMVFPLPLVLQVDTGNPCQALRGLIHQALQGSASVLDVYLSLHRVVVGHNGTVPASPSELLEVQGEPLFRPMASHDLHSLLNREWCREVRVKTPLWAVRLIPDKDGATCVPLDVEVGLEGTWVEMDGAFLDTVTVEWVERCVGFTDVQLQINGVRRPDPLRGQVVLSTGLMDVHLYPADQEANVPGGLRSLGYGWNAVHTEGDSLVLFQNVRQEAFGVLQASHPELVHLPAHLQVVLKPAGKSLLIGSGEGIPQELDESALQKALQEALLGLPAALKRWVEPVMQDMHDGLAHEVFQKRCMQHGLDETWAELALVQSGWRSCPVLLADGTRPEVQVRWRQGALTASNPAEVFTHNLLKLLGDDRPWCGMSQVGEADTIRPQELPLLLDHGQLQVRNASLLQHLLATPDSRRHLLMNITGLTLNPTDTFFTEETDLLHASLLLETVLPSLD